MKAITDRECDRIDRGAMMRALEMHEKTAAELRSRLGLQLREKFETVAPAAVERDGITRLRTDQIDRLYERGVITIDDRAAALKFRRVFEAMSRGLFAGGSRGEPTGTQSRGRFRHPLERMSQGDLFIWFNEYRPWANGPAAKMAVDGESQTLFRRSYLQICYAVIIDNLGPSQLEQVWPVPRGKGVVSRVLAEGLSKWIHKEFDPTFDAEPLRQEILTQAQSRIDQVSPRRRA